MVGEYTWRLPLTCFFLLCFESLVVGELLCCFRRLAVEAVDREEWGGLVRLGEFTWTILWTTRIRNMERERERERERECVCVPLSLSLSLSLWVRLLMLHSPISVAVTLARLQSRALCE